MTTKALKMKLNDIIDRKQKVYFALRGGGVLSAQVKEMMDRLYAEMVAFNSVLDALDGDNYMLNCY